jgi:serine/threonine protein kinase
VGQTGIRYQIFDKIGNGSFGAVFDVKRVVLIGNDGDF